MLSAGCKQAYAL
jgi:hypothetical protein